MNNSDLDIRRKRLVFQSNHRGCKEMDMMMGQFATRFVADMSDADMDIYEALLEEDDKLLWEWLTFRQTPDHQRYDSLLEQMRDYTPLVKQQAQL